MAHKFLERECQCVPFVGSEKKLKKVPKDAKNFQTMTEKDKCYNVE